MPGEVDAGILFVGISMIYHCFFAPGGIKDITWDHPRHSCVNRIPFCVDFLVQQEGFTWLEIETIQCYIKDTRPWRAARCDTCLHAAFQQVIKMK